MKDIKLYYDPYAESTYMKIDGQEHGRSGRRLDSFIVGQPIESWLSAYVYSYRRWDGLLPELMDELNDDALNITFYGLPENGEAVRMSLQEQAEQLRPRGYSDNRWSLCLVPYGLPEDVRKRLLKLARDKRRLAPDQHSLSLFQSAEEILTENGSDITLELLQNARSCIQAAIQAAISFCHTSMAGARAESKERVWQNVEQELALMFWYASRDEQGQEKKGEKL